MHDRGIRRGSFRWIYGNSKYVLELERELKTHLTLTSKEMFIMFLAKIVGWYQQL
jgi:hypothetical protein